MIENLEVDCGIVRVRRKIPPPPPVPPAILALGAVSLFGLMLLWKKREIPITTGRLGGKIVYVKL